MSDQLYNVAVVGATGSVGEVIIEYLTERKFPVDNFFPLASSASAGKKISLNDRYYTVSDIASFDFSQVDFVFFSAGRDVSAQYAPIAHQAGAWVIDNTSEFRYQDQIPLIIPEINGHLLSSLHEPCIIANPNCSTIQMLMAIYPIYQEVGIARINVSTYQAVSGAGKKAIEALAHQTAELLNGNHPEVDEMSRQIAFNLIPQIDVFEENGFTREEMKMIWETHKIFQDDEIQINPTAVRVPVFFGHSESVVIETQSFLGLDLARELLQSMPGVVYCKQDDYPTPFSDAANHDSVYVGRLRQDLFNENILSMWVVADNVRKGAALNAIQIAETLINKSSIH